MLNIQEWFKKNQPITHKQIFISDKDITEPLEGQELIIKDYKDLKYFHIDIKQIRIITIENCELLKDIEVHGQEIKLIGDFKRLRNIKSHSIKEQPTIIYQQKPEGFCWKCFLFWPLTILFIAVNVYWSNKTIKLYKKIRAEHKKLALKNSKN